MEVTSDDDAVVRFDFGRFDGVVLKGTMTSCWYWNE